MAQEAINNYLHFQIKTKTIIEGHRQQLQIVHLLVGEIFRCKASNLVVTQEQMQEATRAPTLLILHKCFTTMWCRSNHQTPKSMDKRLWDDQVVPQIRLQINNLRHKWAIKDPQLITMKKLKNLSIDCEQADSILVSRTELQIIRAKLELIKTELKLISQGEFSKEEVCQTLVEWTASRCHKLTLYLGQKIIKGKLDKDWTALERDPPHLGPRMDMCSQSSILE